MGIELVIDGKTYYIEKYEIQANGKRIIIPYTIHLDQNLVGNCTPKTRKISSVTVEDSSKKSVRPHPMGDLLNDLRGQFNKLQNDLRPKKRQAKPFEQNFR